MGAVLLASMAPSLQSSINWYRFATLGRLDNPVLTIRSAQLASCITAWCALRPRLATRQERDIAPVPILSGHTPLSAAPGGERSAEQCRPAPIAGAAGS